MAKNWLLPSDRKITATRAGARYTETGTGMATAPADSPALPVEAWHSMPAVDLGGSTYRQVFHVRPDVILARSANNVLSVSVDGTTWTNFALATIDPDFASHPDAVVANAVAVDAQTWVIFVHTYLALNGTNVTGLILRTSNGGADWTTVKEFTTGFPSAVQNPDVEGDMVVCGLYGDLFPLTEGFVPSVFVSIHGGVDWTEIDDNGGANTTHVHTVRIIDADHVIVSYGDASATTTAGIFVFEKPEAWEPGGGHWTLVATPERAPIGASGRTVEIMGRGNGLIFLGSTVYTPPTDWTVSKGLSTRTQPLYHHVDEASRKVNYGYPPIGSYESMGYHDGIYYMVQARVDPSTDLLPFGIYVSTDLAHWTCLFRSSAIPRWGYFCGVFTIAGVPTVIVSYSSPSPTPRMITFPVPTVSVQPSIEVLPSVSNSLPAAAAAMTDGHGWFPGNDLGALSLVAGGGRNGGNALAGTVTPTAALTGSFRGDNNNLAACGITPHENDRLVFECWVQATYADGAPVPYVLCTWDWEPTAAQPTIYLLNGVWTRIVLTALCTATTANTLHVDLGFIHTATQPNYTIRVSDARITQSLAETADWLTTSVPLIPGTTTTATDVISLPVSGIPAGHTGVLRWCPKQALAELTQDKPIFTLVAADASYVHCFYDASEGTISLTDGTDTANSTPVILRAPSQCVLAWSADGTDFTLYLWTPREGWQTVTGTDVNCGAPTTILLGSDQTAAGGGLGRFTYPQFYDAPKNEADTKAAAAEIPAIPTVFSGDVTVPDGYTPLSGTGRFDLGSAKVVLEGDVALAGLTADFGTARVTAGADAEIDAATATAILNARACLFSDGAARTLTVLNIGTGAPPLLAFCGCVDGGGNGDPPNVVFQPGAPSGMMMRGIGP